MTNWRRTEAILFALLLALGAFAAGCGDDDDDIENPMDPIDEGPFRRTPEELLTDFFETAYSTRDSALYAEMLCDNYTFEFLQEDAESIFADCGGCSTYWGRTPDLLSTGALIRDVTVTGITLNIQVNSNDEYWGLACLGCRILDATVTLRVATTGDGTEPLIFSVDSPQTFVTKPALGDSTLWCILKQIDRRRSLAKHDGSMTPLSDELRATEETTWGKIKGIFRP